MSDINWVLALAGVLFFAPFAVISVAVATAIATTIKIPRGADSGNE